MVIQANVQEVILAVIGWSFICATDGCVMTAASFGSERSYSPLRWGMAFGFGHLVFAVAGIFLAALLSPLFAGAAYLLAAGAAIFLAHHIWCHSGMPCGHKVARREVPMIVAAITFSVDALFQGVGAHGQGTHAHRCGELCVVSEQHQVAIGFSLLISLAVAVVVGGFTAIAAVIARWSVKVKPGVAILLPTIAMGLLINFSATMVLGVVMLTERDLAETVHPRLLAAGLGFVAAALMYRRARQSLLRSSAPRAAATCCHHHP